MRFQSAAIVLGACATAVIAQQNPAARPPRDVAPLAGRWNGAHLEQRTNCTTAGSNGFHGTYAEYTIRVDAGNTMTMDEVAVTGLTCNYAGTYRSENGRLVWSGNHTCSDGRAGPFETQSIYAQATLMSMRMSMQVPNAGCSMDAILSGARFQTDRAIPGLP